MWGQGNAPRMGGRTDGGREGGSMGFFLSVWMSSSAGGPRAASWGGCSAGWGWGEAAGWRAATGACSILRMSASFIGQQQQVSTRNQLQRHQGTFEMWTTYTECCMSRGGGPNCGQLCCIYFERYSYFTITISPFKLLETDIYSFS